VHRTNTIIVRASQADLALSFYLKQDGCEHVVLERAPAIADAWRNPKTSMTAI
jgi:cation diffusion facilitator CzcD-associated flavoprotein CzcO